MTSPLPESALQQLFTEARSFNGFTAEPVTDAKLRAVLELMKLGPTAANSHPTRFVFVRSPEAKAQLKDALAPGNVEKTMAAPVTVVVAVDPQYHAQLTTLFPARPGMGASLAAMPADKQEFWLTQNSGLEAAGFIYAARALGLDCGPMGGFDREKLDATLLAETGWKSVLLINLGHGDRSKLYPRLPRLAVEQMAKFL